MLPSKAECRHQDKNTYKLESDFQIEENRRFVYPVFMGRKPLHSEKVILLLQGLNERYWNKYLPWARALHKQTGQPVILFPLKGKIPHREVDDAFERVFAGAARHLV